MSTVATSPDSERIRTLDGPVTSEPEPLWRDAPRLQPSNAFPAYRHVPGLNPHPSRDKDGHSYRAEIPPPTPISAENWRQSAPYLHGIDLYHNGYLWEAHEAWESVWRLAEEDSLEANFLQALILNSAAQLKAHLRNPIGARTHSQAARWRLARLRSRGYTGPVMRFFGVCIDDLIGQIRRHYGLVWSDTATDIVRLKGDAPRILPEFE